MARILIVDAREEDRLAVGSILERAGHETIHAADGDQAIEEYLRGSVDVVVTELEMPGLSGFELIDILRDAKPQPPIIAVSGTSPYHLEMARTLGADETLQKPARAEQLLAAVKELTAAGTH